MSMAGKTIVMNGEFRKLGTPISSADGDWVWRQLRVFSADTDNNLDEAVAVLIEEGFQARIRSVLFNVANLSLKNKIDIVKAVAAGGDHTDIFMTIVGARDLSFVMTTDQNASADDRISAGMFLAKKLVERASKDSPGLLEMAADHLRKYDQPWVAKYLFSEKRGRAA